DRGALRVAVDDRGVLRRRGAEPETVDEARLGGRRQRAQHRAQSLEIRAVQPVSVDLARWDHTHHDAFGARNDGAEELITLRGRQLLRVVEVRERPRTVVAETVEIEQNS